MQQESGSKRLLFGVRIGHDGVKYVECCFSIDIGIFLYFLDGRSFFVDRLQLAHRGAWEGTSIWCGCTFSGHVSWIAAIEAKLVIESPLAFLWREPAASSAAAPEVATTPLGRIYFDGGIFFNFPNAGILGPEAPRGGAARSIIDAPSLIQFSGFLYQTSQSGGLWGDLYDLLV